MAIKIETENNSVTLATSGKYCEDNIEVNFTGSNGGGIDMPLPEHCVYIARGTLRKTSGENAIVSMKNADDWSVGGNDAYALTVFTKNTSTSHSISNGYQLSIAQNVAVGTEEGRSARNYTTYTAGSAWKRETADDRKIAELTGNANYIFGCIVFYCNKTMFDANSSAYPQTVNLGDLVTITNAEIS